MNAQTMISTTTQMATNERSSQPEDLYLHSGYLYGPVYTVIRQ